MFEMTFSDGIKRGMAFDSAAHPQIYITPAGSHITQKDWAKMKRRLALDKAIKPFDGDLVRQKDHPEAFDDDDGEVRPPDIKALRKYLHENTGLSWDVIEEACTLCELQHGEPAEDYLPASGLRSAGGMGGRLSGERSRLGEGPRPALGTKSAEKRGSSVLSEQEYRSSPASDSASFFAMFPDASRIGTTYGSSQFDPAPPLTAKARKIAADHADGETHLLEMFGPDGPARVGVGEWPKRR
jgi:hypothetical protein